MKTQLPSLFLLRHQPGKLQRRPSSHQHHHRTTTRVTITLPQLTATERRSWNIRTKILPSDQERDSSETRRPVGIYEQCLQLLHMPQKALITLHETMTTQQSTAQTLHKSPLNNRWNSLSLFFSNTTTSCHHTRIQLSQLQHNRLDF